MCGRYTLRRPDFLSLGLRADPFPEFEEFTERPRFNVAPSQQLPIVRASRTGGYELVLVRWGLIPSWTKDKPKAQPIKAKLDQIRVAFAWKRNCIEIANMCRRNAENRRAGFNATRRGANFSRHCVLKGNPKSSDRILYPIYKKKNWKVGPLTDVGLQVWHDAKPEAASEIL